MITKDYRLSKDQRTAFTACHHSGSASGFTLVELCVVMAITVVMASLAVPQVMKTYYSAQVRDAANQFSALVQQANILAEQKNVTIPVYTGAVQNGANGAFIACSSSSCPSGGNGTSYQSGDTAVSFAGDVTSGSSSSAPSGLSPGFTAATGTMYFSPRGTTVTAPGGFGLANGYVFYFKDSRGDWAAVSVTSIGRTKVWVWNGSNWN